MVNDRVGDFIIRFQNAARIGRREVVAPYSAHLLAIAKKLAELGFITSVDVEGKDTKRIIRASLVYDERGRARVRGVKRISKPGRRLYAPYTHAHQVKGGTGARLFSTSVGVLSDTEVRRHHIGGEELFEIW